jgi:hypothetical protein
LFSRNTMVMVSISFFNKHNTCNLVYFYVYEKKTTSLKTAIRLVQKICDTDSPHKYS